MEKPSRKLPWKPLKIIDIFFYVFFFTCQFELVLILNAIETRPKNKKYFFFLNLKAVVPDFTTFCIFFSFRKSKSLP